MGLNWLNIKFEIFHKKFNGFRGIGIYLVTFFVAYLVYCNTRLNYIFLPKDINFLQYDVGWYESIKDKGYEYDANKQSNVGFFPLFPYLWKLTNLSYAGIALFNALIFGISFYFLTKELKIRTSIQWVFLSLPSIFFFYIPYTESLFFASCSILVVGLNRQSSALIFIGSFLASMVRPTFIFLIPAFIATYLLQNKKGKPELYRMLSGVFGCFVGLWGVMIIQYISTGEWGVYFYAQTTFWSHKFGIPFPWFSTWGAERLLWLDGAAFFFAFLCFFKIIKFFIDKIKNKTPNANFSSEYSLYIFAITYLAMLFPYYLFFNHIANGITLMSINRYFFCNVFFLLLLQGNRTSQYLREWSPLFLIISLLAYCSRLDKHMQAVLFLVVYLLLWNLYSQKGKGGKVLIMINIFLQVHLWHEFLQGKWVG